MSRTSLLLLAVSISIFSLVGKSLGQATAPEMKTAPKQIEVLRLQHVPSDEVSRVIMSIFDKGKIKVAADNQTNSLIVSSERATLDVVRAVVENLDVPSQNQPRKSEAPSSYRIHIDWLLANNPKIAGDSLKELPEKFRDVDIALSRHGIKGLKLAAATVASINPEISPEFTLGCSPIDSSVSLEIFGNVIRQENGIPAVNVEIRAVQERNKSKQSLANVSTSVSTPIGHPVVLAVAPVEGTSSVFVVTVEDPISSRTTVEKSRNSR